MLNPFYPLQDAPPTEVRVAAGTQTTPVVLHQDLKPRAEFTDAHIVKQQYDYSCGSAALATLLNYYLGENLTERQIIEGLVEYGDKKQIEKLRAFSLLDMKRFVEKLGYKGAGYKAEIADLRTLGKPCIVPMEIFGYQHFCRLPGNRPGSRLSGRSLPGECQFPRGAVREDVAAQCRFRRHRRRYRPQRLDAQGRGPAVHRSGRHAPRPRHVSAAFRHDGQYAD
ncbi:MAG: cysteine peptidase family C39 domain-containing protein [Desulfobacterales bacterium]|nr:cysteine peptidase family C39 domain-containing protein [Desulfobacterales bacterium]